MENKVCYLVDDITRPVPCSLVIRYGISNIRIRKVAIGLAIPEHHFHGRKNYRRVLHGRSVDNYQRYEDNMLDIPNLEDIETLGQVMKKIIIWSRRNVQLCVPQSSSSDTSRT
jgi:hypothetical protein